MIATAIFDTKPYDRDPLQSTATGGKLFIEDSALPQNKAMLAILSRSWIHMIAFALILATAVYVICDLKFPQLESIDRLLVELRNCMN